jgi:hypothetical protein
VGLVCGHDRILARLDELEQTLGPQRVEEHDPHVMVGGGGTRYNAEAGRDADGGRWP